MGTIQRRLAWPLRKDDTQSDFPEDYVAPIVDEVADAILPILTVDIFSGSDINVTLFAVPSLLGTEEPCGPKSSQCASICQLALTKISRSLACTRKK